MKESYGTRRTNPSKTNVSKELHIPVATIHNCVGHLIQNSDALKIVDDELIDFNSSSYHECPAALCAFPRCECDRRAEKALPNCMKNSTFLHMSLYTIESRCVPVCPNYPSNCTPQSPHLLLTFFELAGIKC
ncbi:hypothetical protein VNO78_24993 [Psophocarpus tetragonolobus]|uniref:Uncharacterized protein n=1 Tax=Psophocarpus tetragonolobus TaxID=3891 RepID=A0AAN9S5Q3_PSOTE